MQRATTPQVFPLDDPFYPSCDGEPMADNQLQFRWITTIQGAIDALFLDDPNVLVAGDCLWYPVEGDNTIRVAPDTMVIFGRPKADRGSYIQHREEGVPVQVTFEILSPGNRAGEMKRKLEFYERYGVEEYYVLDPDFGRHKGYLRAHDKLVPIADLFGWTSPRLGIRFEIAARLKPELRILNPDGRPFQSYTDIVRQRDETEQQLADERDRANDAKLQADQERERANDATLRAERLLAQLRALGLEPEQ